MGKVRPKEVNAWLRDEEMLDDELMDDLIWWDKEQDNRMFKEYSKRLPNGVTVDPEYTKYIKENY